MYSKAGVASLLLTTATAQVTQQVTLQNVNGQAANPVKANSNVVVPEVDDQSFWFANFSVGASPSLELLIDTGSSDVYLNPGVYKAGPKSKNLNRQFSITFATTNSDGSGTETVSGPLYDDAVSIAGLSVAQQAVGASTSPTNPPAFPHDGLIGFAGQDGSASNSVPWFTNLCNQKLVPACRFGLAFKTDGTGSQTLGGVDAAYANSLSSTPITSEWSIRADIIAGGKTVASKSPIITDSGTTVVYGPLNTVRAIFQQLNIPTTEHVGTNPSTDPSYIFGYTPCDKPPSTEFGLGIGGKAFNIEAAAWNAKDNGNNNCTTVLQGTNSFGQQWLVGQAFFQGKYVDHDVDAGTMGFANLKGSQSNATKPTFPQRLSKKWHA